MSTKMYAASRPFSVRIVVGPLVRPSDEGLFGDEANQTDLVDLAGRPKAAKP